MIHAGVLFWHVRRYSIDAFYEPQSVFLATLALWAYGSFAKHTSSTIKSAPVEGNNEGGELEEEELEPSSMQLDRPADDELVQMFVKRGAGMKAMITGVGNLCSVKGPGRVLVEGRVLMEGLGRWGYGREGMSILMALERTEKEKG